MRFMPALAFTTVQYAVIVFNFVQAEQISIRPTAVSPLVPNSLLHGIIVNFQGIDKDAAIRGLLPSSPPTQKLSSKHEKGLKMVIEDYDIKLTDQRPEGINKNDPKWRKISKMEELGDLNFNEKTESPSSIGNNISNNRNQDQNQTLTTIKSEKSLSASTSFENWIVKLLVSYVFKTALEQEAEKKVKTRLNDSLTDHKSIKDRPLRSSSYQTVSHQLKKNRITRESGDLGDPAVMSEFVHEKEKQRISKMNSTEDTNNTDTNNMYDATLLSRNKQRVLDSNQKELKLINDFLVIENYINPRPLLEDSTRILEQFGYNSVLRSRKIFGKDPQKVDQTYKRHSRPFGDNYRQDFSFKSQINEKNSLAKISKEIETALSANQAINQISSIIKNAIGLVDSLEIMENDLENALAETDSAKEGVSDFKNNFNGSLANLGDLLVQESKIESSAVLYKPAMALLL